MANFVANAEANLDNMIANSMRGNGPLSGYFLKRRREISENIKGNEELALHDNPNILRMTDENIRVRTNELLRNEAEKFIKPELQKAINPNNSKVKQEINSADLGENIKHGMVLADAATGTYAAVSSNNIFGLFGPLMNLMSYIGDYVTAAISYMTGKRDDPNAPKSYGEALQNIRAPKRLNELAQKIPGMDVQGTIAYLAEDPSKHSKPDKVAPAKPVVAAPQALPEKLDVQLDSTFTQATIDSIAKSTDKGEAMQNAQKAVKESKIEFRDGLPFATVEAAEAFDKIPSTIQLPTERDGNSWRKDESPSK